MRQPESDQPTTTLGEVEQYIESITESDKDDTLRAIKGLESELKKMREAVEAGNSPRYWLDGHLVRKAAEVVEQATSWESHSRVGFVIRNQKERHGE